MADTVLISDAMNRVGPREVPLHSRLRVPDQHDTDRLRLVTTEI